MEALQSGPGATNLPPSAPSAITETLQSASVSPTEAISSPTVIAEATIETAAPTATEALISTDTPGPVETAIATQVAASPTPEATFVVPTLPSLTNEQRWRAQEIDRNILEPPQVYTTTSSELWWFDPINQQHIILGTFSGDFIAQARFTLRGQGIEALEVPYQVNKSYGLTALSPAIVARIEAAGDSEWIETYVFVTPNIAPR